MTDKAFDEIMVGETVSFRRSISEEDVEFFSRLSGDKNPLHLDETYAQSTQFGGRVVHGMFLAALISKLVGMHLPGKHALLLSEELRFKAPARIGDAVKVIGTVSAKSIATQIIDVVIQIKKDSTVLAEGMAKVQIVGN